MRGSETYDGKLSGNRQIVDRYNEAKGKKKKKESSMGLGGGAAGFGEQRPSERGGTSAGEREPGGHDEAKRLVDEHGAAVSHHIMKTRQGYHSVMQHEDGHVSHADHATLGEAHEHGRSAMGEDTDHLGDMGREDAEVAGEAEGAESRGGMGGSRIGYMA